VNAEKGGTGMQQGSLGNSEGAPHLAYLARCRDYNVRARSLGTIGDCKYREANIERAPSRNLIEISLNRGEGEKVGERERERGGSECIFSCRRAAAASEKLT